MLHKNNDYDALWQIGLVLLYFMAIQVAALQFCVVEKERLHFCSSLLKSLVNFNTEEQSISSAKEILS